MSTAELSDSETQALLESWRQLGLRLDRQGRFWHQGNEISHPRLIQALLGWLDRLPDGRYVVRLDAERYAYLEVEDAPYLVRTVTVERGPSGPLPLLLLSDGSEEELDCASLAVGADHALYCQVKRGRFEARFSHQAYYLLGELIEETAEGFALRAAGQLWPIGQRPG